MMIIAIITIICLAGSHVEGFLFAFPSSTTIHHHLDRRDHRRNQHPRKHHQFDDSSTMLRMSTGKEDDDDDDEEEAQKILGNTWFAKSSSSSIISDNTIQTEDDSVSPQQIEYYDVGISGTAFQTGALSQRMYATMCSQMSIDIETPAATTTKDNDNDTTDIQKALMLYALDFTAKEATSAALEQLYGMDLFEVPQQANAAAAAEKWGTLEAIRGVPHDDDKSKTNTYQSIEDVIEHGNWIPGQSFDFIVRNVPTKSKSMTEELVQALDPDGKLRKEANELRSSSSSSSSEEEKEDDTSTTSTTAMNTDDDDDPSIDEEALLSIFDEEIGSLSEMATDNIRRTEEAPRGSTDESQAYSGLTHQRGYKIINRKDLVSSDATENEQSKFVYSSCIIHSYICWRCSYLPTYLVYNVVGVAFYLANLTIRDNKFIIPPSYRHYFSSQFFCSIDSCDECVSGTWCIDC